MEITFVCVPFQVDVARWGCALGPQAFLDAGIAEQIEARGHSIRNVVWIELPKAAEIEILQRHPILHIDASQLMQTGVAERVQSALRPRSAEATGWYLHLDLDVAGPEELPGGMTPAPYWPPRHHLIEAVGAATRSVSTHVLALAVYNPAQDSDRRGARLGFDMAMAVIDNL